MITKGQRKLRNYLLEPGVQLRYALYFFGFSAVAAVLNQMILLRSLQQLLLGALLDTHVDGAVLAASVAGPLGALSWRSLMLFPILGLCCALFAIRITHRFVGPQVALRRTIDALKHGDYEATCTLRKDDHLQAVATSLNELADALQEREARLAGQPPVKELAA